MKFHVSGFTNKSAYANFGSSLTKIVDTLHEDVHTFIIVTRRD
jgi:hypothetical protein